MILKVDHNIYSDSCISKAVYWLSSRFAVERKSESGIETITVHDVDDEKDVKIEFVQMLNDFKLRELIQAETKDIRTILYAKAFGDFDELTEEDLEK